MDNGCQFVDRIGSDIHCEPEEFSVVFVVQNGTICSIKFIEIQNRALQIVTGPLPLLKVPLFGSIIVIIAT